MQKVGGAVISEQHLADDGKQVLNEEFLANDERQVIIDQFLDYVYERLELKGDEKPVVEMLYDDDKYTQEYRSFASYHPGTYDIKIVAKNRNLADILRSLAHEVVHHKQNLLGVLHEKSGETGSKHENQANALAGSLMRDYGKINPKIYE